ncbi:MAG TPA: HD domain-containing phosphohydrolase [Candidatus Hydrogenedentes bacterium]|nr:HD domain-containing phosphohydrolase [Candidatus Hydrogenedentota bacterium]
MLKRIAVVGASEKSAASLMAKQECQGLLLAALGAKEKVQAGTVAAVGEPRHIEAVLNAARAIGEEHEGILNLLACAIDCREGITPGASERVRDHAARFARALNLSPDDQLLLERGALLRDVGKIKVPNEVLLKHGVLTYDEWLLLQAHSTLGAELLREQGVCPDVLEIVHYHHECYDGDGYPDHLEKEAIPYFARIMKIVDVYCAMTSPRHYRAHQSSHKDALLFLNSERGKHFDPQLIDVFVASEVGQST